MLRIGIISDTHGLLRPEAEAALAGCDHILHAGDIGRPEVIEGLRRIAPVTAIRGNVDRGAWAAAIPDAVEVALGGRSFHLVHDRKALAIDPVAAGIDAVVSGHSHKPKAETLDGVLYLNPGSAGPRRFSLPVALAILELDGAAMTPRILELA